ncbi:MAG: Ig-like domain-containing protein, partial [Cyanobacteria bacterium P01_G01_bin.49]
MKKYPHTQDNGQVLPQISSVKGETLVIIDGNVDNPQQLEQGVAKGVTAIVLDRHRDGIEQITEVLDKNSFQSFHLVSHGWAGGIQLGNTQLSLNTIDQYLSQLQTWSKKLAGASMFLYGCQVALGEQGHRFLERLHQITGANLAASSDRVGNALRGGNWDLNFQLGQINRQLAFLPETQQAYAGVFIPTIGITADELTLIEDEGSVTTITLNLSEPPPAEGVVVTIANNTPFALGDFDVLPPPPQASFTGGQLVQVNADNSGLQFRVTAQTATITLPIFNDADLPPGDPNATRNDDVGVEESIFSLVDGDTYDVDPSASQVTFTLADTASQLAPPPPPVTPTVSFQTNTDTLFESEGTVLTFTFDLSEPPPPEGVNVTVNGDVAQNLNQLDVFNIAATGGEFPVPDFDNTGFSFLITEQTATVSSPIFNDGNPEDPVTVNYTLAPGDGYEVDPGANQASVTFADSPAPVNAPPVATDDSGTTPEDAPVTGNVLNNDSDPDGDPLTVSAVNGEAGNVGSPVTLASGALLTVNGDGSYSYDPNGQFESLNDGETATDSFDYTLSDGQETTTATATITIDGVGVTPPPPVENQPPVATDDSGTTPENAPFTGNVLGNDSDPDGDPLTVSAVNGEASSVGTPVTLASGALLTVNGDGSYSYDPNGQFESLNDGETATDSFDYTLSDGQETTIATATITIDGVGVTPPPPVENQPPVATDDSGTTPENAPLTDNVLDNDSDPDGDPLSVSAVNGEAGNVGSSVTLASGALLTVNGDGSYSYDPNGQFESLNEGETATDSFDYTLSDGQETTTATATITIDGVGVTPPPPVENQPPAATDDAYISDQSQPVTANVLDNDTDPDGDPLSAILDQGPSNGTLDFNEDGSFTYTPDQGFTGTDSFTYQASDGTDSSDPATVTLEVTQAPVTEESLFFGTSGNDTFDVAITPDFDGNNDLAFTGSGDDLIDTTAGSGGNRLYGGSDNDTFFLGNNNRAFGGEGDDIFYFEGGNNVVTGETGADQFWLAMGDIPQATNTITDFELDIDVLGVSDLSLSFQDLTLIQQNSNTLITSNGEE